MLSLPAPRTDLARRLSLAPRGLDTQLPSVLGPSPLPDRVGCWGASSAGRLLVPVVRCIPRAVQLAACFG